MRAVRNWRCWQRSWHEPVAAGSSAGGSTSSASRASLSRAQRMSWNRERQLGVAGLSFCVGRARSAQAQTAARPVER